MSKVQTIDNKKGEIEFRKKLVAQIQTNNTCITGQPTQEEYITILKQRVDDTRIIFKKLQKKGIPLSPFLEIGAERGQRAMVLSNEFDAQGYYSDISYDSLIYGKTVAKSLGFKKLPIGICCDAYNLPFKTGSIPFIFCFQTLHHFPDPKPVFEEIKRVLTPGGYFYFNEEPIKHVFNLNLWRRDYHLRWFEKILKTTGLLHFISQIGKSEVDHAILEKEFSLETWEKALNVFPNVETKIFVFPFGPTIYRTKTKPSGWMNSFFLSKALLYLLGGGIEALCQKEHDRKWRRPHYTMVSALLACPNCKHKPNLKATKNGDLLCTTCNSSFKNKNGVLMLFSKQQKSLYPKDI